MKLLCCFRQSEDDQEEIYHPKESLSPKSAVKEEDELQADAESSKETIPEAEKKDLTELVTGVDGDEMVDEENMNLMEQEMSEEEGELEEKQMEDKKKVLKEEGGLVEKASGAGEVRVKEVTVVE